MNSEDSINEICCICLDEVSSKCKIECIKFECCGNKIHKECLFDVMMRKKNILDNLNDNCPFCRKEYSFKTFIKLDDIEVCFENYMGKRKSNEKINDITCIKERKKLCFIVNKYYNNRKRESFPMQNFNFIQVIISKLKKIINIIKINLHTYPWSDRNTD